MYTSFAEQQCPLERGMDESPNHQLNQNISCASTWIQQHTDRVLLSTIQAVMVSFRPIWLWDDSVLKEDGFKPLCCSNSSDQLSCESMHIYMDTRTDRGMGSGKRSPYGAQYPWRWASVSTKVEKKGHHQTNPEQWRQTPPVDPRAAGPVVTSWTVSSVQESWSKSDCCHLTAPRRRRPATTQTHSFNNQNKKTTSDTRHYCSSALSA